MHAIARIRIFLARHPWVRWSAVVVLATTVGWSIQQRLAAIEHERTQWGSTTAVVVAATDLDPDEPLSIEIVEMPNAILPDQALTSLPDDAVLHQRVVRGEVLTAVDISTTAGPAARAEPGTAVVGIVDPLSRNVAVGVTVRVASEGVTLALQASVVGVHDDVIFVAVGDNDAAMVAAAAQRGLASLIFLP